MSLTSSNRYIPRPFRSVRIGAGAVLLFALACASDRAPNGAVAVAPQKPESAAAEKELRALLLLLADQRRYEPAALDALLDGTPAAREALAVATGRIGDPRGRGVLQGLMIDVEPPVRRAAVFAAGELGASEARSSLLRASVDDDPECGRLAVEALGKLETPLGDVRRALTAIEPEEADRRLAPNLFRFPDRGPEGGLVEAAKELLVSPQPEVRIGAAYALGRVAPPGGVELLRGLVADAEPRIRAAAARGLGEIGGPQELARLEPLLEDAQASPKVQALRAGAKILGRVAALPPIGWGERLVELLRAPEPGVRATAIESSAPWLGQSGVRAAILSVAGNGEARERELALLALARSGGEDAAALVRRAATDPDRFLRARAAEGAAFLGLQEPLQALLADPEPAVRVAAASALFDGAPVEEVGELAHRLLADPDPAVRTVALDALAENPVLAGLELVRAFEGAASDRTNDVRLSAVRALAARGAREGVEPAEQEAVATVLRRLVDDRDYLVRREAAAGLAQLGVPPPPVGPVDTGKTGPVYALILEQTAVARYVEFETERGAIVARLDCPEAPLTCLSFLQLAAQGYFDGTRFHRVVPDFVVQGGDPRGDGWGGPGYTLRDEINRSRFDRGALGMALSGPDTGGSQFFFTLAPQPHLDGGYTVFGRVVRGEPILDQIRQGDLLRKVRETAWNE